jgi:hypothetical protein
MAHCDAEAKREETITSDRCIEDPVVIQKILNHLKEKGEYQDAFRLPESRGPPQTSLFG